MEIAYRKLFLKDMKKLKNLPIYGNIFNLVFETIPAAKSIADISNLKHMKGHVNRYRIRIGNYRIGVESYENHIEMVRVLHRNEIYRYFP